MTINAITSENLITGMTETIEIAPDLYIDIPMLYEYLAKLISPQLEKKVSIARTFLTAYVTSKWFSKCNGSESRWFMDHLRSLKAVVAAVLSIVIEPVHVLSKHYIYNIIHLTVGGPSNNIL